MVNDSSPILEHSWKGVSFPNSNAVSPETVQILDGMMRINRNILCNRAKGLCSETTFLGQLDADHGKILVVDETLKDRTEAIVE